MNILGVTNNLIQSYGYYAVFAFIALESLGIPLPGETALIAAAVYAGSTHNLNIGIIFVFAATAAIAGDNVGYWLGQRGGHRLVERYGHYIRLDTTKLKMARYLFAEHGGKVVFLGRFITVLRTYAAFLAGMNQMRWRRFLAYNAAGGLAWSAVYAFGSYSLGAAATTVGHTVAVTGLFLTAGLTAAGVVITRRSMRGLQQRATLADPDSPARAMSGSCR